MKDPSLYYRCLAPTLFDGPSSLETGLCKCVCVFFVQLRVPKIELPEKDAFADSFKLSPSHHVARFSLLFDPSNAVKSVVTGLFCKVLYRSTTNPWLG